MPLSNKSFAAGKWLILIGLSLLICLPAQGQNKKKKKYKKKSDASLISRGYHDVTTRNNYYFNAKLIYLDMLADVDLNYEVDYDELLPLYFHQKYDDFSAYSGSLETIIKKTSIVMHLHDNTRWKDNVYVLLGKARYLNGEYYDALKTFQFVTTTMEQEVGKTKGKVDNKAKLKALKAKEAQKRAKERQKELEAKKEAMKEALEKLKRDKEKEMASNSKNTQKEIQQKIKAKNKIIELRKKGKEVPQKLLDAAYGKKDDKEEVADSPDGTAKPAETTEAEKKEEATIVTYKTDFRSDKKKQKQEEAARQNEQGYLGDTIPMTEKQAEKFDDLTFWEKIKHKSSRPEALVWMALSYMKTGDMLSAQSVLEYAEALPKLTRAQREEVYAGEAYYYIENRRFENALEALDNASQICKKKKRTYYQYISAQIQELQKNIPQAIEYHQAIADGKADYQMKFYSNMKMIELMEGSGAYSNADILAQLTKILKNGSNKPYRDQIHYKIAAIYASEGDLDKTTEHLQSSITASKSNPEQKAMSFRELAEVYIIRRNYDAAVIFMDSAVATLPVEHAEFKALEFRAMTISEVAYQDNIISETDSLLLLSGMTEKDLELYLADLEKRNKVEEKKKRRKGSSVTSFIEEAVTVETGTTFASAEWYFYNPNLRNQGFNQFRLIWGDRKHEHDWRRLNKDANFYIEIPDEIDEPAEVEEAEFSDIREQLSIPSSPEEIAAAHDKLVEAYYELGKLFRINLEMSGEAKRAFESIVQQYPDFDQIDRVYYYLYLIYTDEGNTAQANRYKDILLENYPVSQYAYAINHPYVPSSGDEDYRPEPTQIEQLYASTYTMFQDGKYTDVIRNRNQAYDAYKENPLMPKFDFLEALSYGHLDSLAELKSKLGAIVAKYPNHEVEKKAREYLAIINSKENEEGFEDTVMVMDESDTTAFVSIYTNAESDNIFAMIILEDQSLDIRQMIQLLDQFNSTNFEVQKLRTSNAYLDKETPLILVKRFREKGDAIEYMKALESSLGELFGPEGSGSLKLMMITNDNFRTLFTTKKLEEYREFFEKTYN